MNHETAWTNVLAALQRELSAEEFDNWFASIKLQGVDSTTVRLSVVTAFTRKWLNDKYGDMLLRLWQSEDASVTSVVVVERGVERFRKAPARIRTKTVTLPPRAAVSTTRSQILLAVPPSDEAQQTRNPDRTIFLSDVTRILSTAFGVSRPQLEVASRTTKVLWMRRMAMYIASVVTPLSRHAIGQHFGRDGHAVSDAIDRVKKRMESEPAFKQQVEKFEQLVLND